ncbi:hypothetical protein D3H65_00700 [Paraflavitalea soli]|uniref:Uncharacterized protein n=1 Tax=Paraflavitalea soli TaxID=2315862 RepID=A0A3B7MGZ0_9BACT|nr:hypothetical protein D3H65_00700 [Paraflavitalea soli]
MRQVVQYRSNDRFFGPIGVEKPAKGVGRPFGAALPDLRSLSKPAERVGRPFGAAHPDLKNPVEAG